MPTNYTANDVLGLAEAIISLLNAKGTRPGETAEDFKKELLSSLTLEQIAACHLIDSIREEELGLKSEKAGLLLPRYATTLNMLQRHGDQLQIKVADMPWRSPAQLTDFLKRTKTILDLNDH